MKYWMIVLMLIMPVAWAKNPLVAESSSVNKAVNWWICHHASDSTEEEILCVMEHQNRPYMEHLDERLAYNQLKIRNHTGLYGAEVLHIKLDRWNFKQPTFNAGINQRMCNRMPISDDDMQLCMDRPYLGNLYDLLNQNLLRVNTLDSFGKTKLEKIWSVLNPLTQRGYQQLVPFMQNDLFSYNLRSVLDDKTHTPYGLLDICTIELYHAGYCAVEWKNVFHRLAAEGERLSWYTAKKYVEGVLQSDLVRDFYDDRWDNPLMPISKTKRDNIKFQTDDQELREAMDYPDVWLKPTIHVQQMIYEKNTEILSQYLSKGLCPYKRILHPSMFANAIHRVLVEIDTRRGTDLKSLWQTLIDPDYVIIDVYPLHSSPYDYAQFLTRYSSDHRDEYLPIMNLLVESNNCEPSQNTIKH